MAEVVIVADAAAGGALVADEIARLVRANPDAVLGLATGSTPLAGVRGASRLGWRASTSRACAASPSTSTWASTPRTPRATAR